MTQLSKKNYLGVNLERMYKEFPQDYDFFPKTWTFPYDKIRFLQYYKVPFTNFTLTKFILLGQ